MENRKDYLCPKVKVVAFSTRKSMLQNTSFAQSSTRTGDESMDGNTSGWGDDFWN